MGFLSDVKTDLRPVPEDNVAHVRSRARRRLIGAAALLAVGVIGFPLLFETKPRPVAADVPAVQSSRDRAAAPGQTKVVERPAVTAAAAAATTSATSAAAAQPAAPGTTSPPMITERAQDAGREIPIPTTAADAARVAQEKAERERVEKERLDKERLDKERLEKERVAKDKADKDKAERLAADKARDDKAKADKERQEKERATQAKADRDRQAREQQAKADEQRRAKADDERRARSAAQAKTAAATKPAASDAGRFAVQVGAYASDSSVRDVRNRLERVGLRSYTQVVKVGTRVRTGPYDSRQEAEKAADKARSIGLAPSIVSLTP